MFELGALLVVFMVLLFLGVPVGFALGAAATLVMVFAFDLPLATVAGRAIDGVNAWIWLAVVLFITAGNAMNASGVTRAIVNFSQVAVGHIAGGLSHVAVLTNALMAGMSGSIIADAGAVGTFMIPPMKKAGYTPGYSAAVISTSSIIGPLIPPSVPLIIIGTVTGTSIIRLWLGGAIPGFIVACLLITVSYFLSKRRGYRQSVERASPKQVGASFVKAVPALIVPIIIIGGMRAGIFTPTEGGAVAVAYIMLCGLFIYRGFGWKGLGQVFFNSARHCGAIMWIIAMGTLFSVAVALTQSSETLTSFFMSFCPNRQIFLALMVVFVLFLGCFIDILPMMLIFAPLLTPVASAYGVNLVHFGVLFCYAALVGQFTPPYGVVMYMLCDMADCSIGDYFREGWIFVATLIAGAFIVAFYSPFVLWLPELIMQ